MRNFMAHVNKIRGFRSNASRDFHRRLNGQMCGVIRPSQRVQNQNPRPPRCRYRLLRHIIAVRIIRQQLPPSPRKNKPVGREPPMRQLDRLNRRLPQVKQTMKLNRLGADIRFENRPRRKRILKNPLERLHRSRCRINRHPTVLHLAKPPQIIKTQNVIRMRMRIKNRIQPPQIQPQTLRAKIRRCIYGKRRLGSPDQSRRPQPLVPRIFRLAHRTIAADHRNSHRSPRAQKGELHPAHIQNPNSLTPADLRQSHFLENQPGTP